MKGTPAIYLGRIVSKENFRTFVYSPYGSKKLVESWDEFEKEMASGLWFSTKKDALSRIVIEKPKRGRNVIKKNEESIIEEELIPVPGEEVNADDFLPKEN